MIRNSNVTGTVIVIAWLCLFILSSLLLFQSLSLVGRLVWSIFAILISLLLYLLGVFRCIDHQREIAGESCVVHWRFGRRTIKPLHHRNAPSVFTSIIEDAPVWYIVPLVLLACTYPFLTQLDNWFFNHYREFHMSFQSMMNGAVDRIVEDRAAFALDFWPKLIVYRTVGPGKLLPSTAIGLLMLLIMESSLLIALAMRSVMGMRRREKILQSIMYLNKMAQFIDLTPLFQTLAQQLSLVLNSRRNRRYPYLFGRNTVPLMKQTCEIIESAHTLGIHCDQTAKMIEWIHTCENPTGGFAAEPGGVPNIVHTASGLHMLQHIKHKPHYPLNIHERWLRRALRTSIHKTLPETMWLEQLHLCLEAIHNTDQQLPLSQTYQKCLASETLIRWKHTSQCVGKTVSMTCILALTSPYGSTIPSEIMTRWIPSRISFLRESRLHSNLPELGTMLRLIYCVDPDFATFNEPIMQLRDNLIKTYTSSS